MNDDTPITFETYLEIACGLLSVPMWCGVLWALMNLEYIGTP